MEFIKAREKDLDLVYSIVSQSVIEAYGKHYPQEVVDFFLMIHRKENILSDILNFDLWLIKDKGEFVGTGFAKGNHISRVYMLPECQGKGYGTKIMDYLEDIISQDYDTAILDPSKMAIPFYEKRGYKIISHEDTTLKGGTYLAHDVMEKKLK